MLSRILISAVGAASAVSALVPRGACNADNCLRALRASSPQTRLAQAQADCAAWLVVTVTPPVSTATEYTTISSTETTVEQITVTNEVHTTLVSTVYETPTETVYTSTATSTIQAGDAAVTTIVPLLRRADPTIPAYASACSGAVRFSSACSCIGVSTAAATVTASASTTTITLPATVSATIQATSVVATSQVLVVDTTSIQTITVPASTVFAVTTTTATQTSSSTSTTSQAPTPTSFKVGISGGSHGTGYLGIYSSGALDYALWTSDASQAVILTLNPDASLYYNGKIALGDATGASALQLFFYNGYSVRKPLSCAVDSDNTLTCKTPSAAVSNDKFGISSQMSATPIIYTGSEAALIGSSRPLVTLKVIAI